MPPTIDVQLLINVLKEALAIPRTLFYTLFVVFSSLILSCGTTYLSVL